MLKKLFALCLGFISVAAFCGEQTGKIADIRVRTTDGLHWFYVEGTTENPASCASEDGRWMIEDENSVAGKSIFSMVLLAYASGKTVTVYGTGECTRWSTGEDVRTLNLQ